MRILIVILGLWALPVWGEGSDDSPFLPENLAAGAMGGAAPDGSSFELRGIMSTAGGTKYCIYNPMKKTSSWVGLNENGGNFEVKSADPAHDTVTLEAAGQRMTLALREAKVVSLGFASPAAAIPPAGVLDNGAPSSDLGDERKRLQAVVEEVRRRRELRQKANSK
jgi:hypothetical protein